MTAVAARPAVSTPLSGWALALLLPVGPAAVGALRFLLPYWSAGSTPEQVAATYQELDQQGVVLWLGLVATLTLVPGSQLAARLTRPAAPRLTAWALALVVPAYLCLSGVLVADHVLWSAGSAGVDPGAAADVLDAAHPSLDIALGVFVVGHVVGTVVFGVALLRSRTVPAWAGWAMLVSQPLHFLAVIVVGSPVLDLVAWSLTTVAMVVVARALLRGGLLR